jgi:hypothetical protein
MSKLTRADGTTQTMADRRVAAWTEAGRQLSGLLGIGPIDIVVPPVRPVSDAVVVKPRKVAKAKR